jgi:hypothetical protein
MTDRAIREATLREAAAAARDFGWTLPMFSDRALNEASDDAACMVQVQIADAILALIDKDPPAPAAPVVTDAMVERFEAAMQGWVVRMLELADGAVWTPSTEQARLILTETLAIVEDAERKINGSILQETPDAS